MADAPPLLRLRLYIAGTAPNSVKAVTNARAICQDHFGSSYELEVVDLLMHPNRAAEDGIIVTPTLLKLSSPIGRLIGSLSDAPSVLAALKAR